MTVTTRQPSHPDLIAPQQAARIANVHVRTLVRWVRRGYLTEYLTPGREHRYDLAELNAWLALATPATVAPPTNPLMPEPDVAAIIDTDPHCRTCTCYETET